MQLTKLRKAGIEAVLNEGIGCAQTILRQITSADAQLSVTKVNLMNSSEFDQVLDISRNKITTINQVVEGTYDGSAILMLPEHKCLELVRALLRDSVPLQEMTEMEEDSLVEVGNVILNACVGSLSNLLAEELRTGLPQLKRNALKLIFENLNPGQIENQNLLVMQIDFQLNDRSINCYLAVFLNVRAMTHLLKTVDVLNSDVA